MRELTAAETAKVLQFLDKMSPPGTKILTVSETGRGGPGINIPMNPQTSPNSFRAASDQSYPKIFTKPCEQADVDEFMRRNSSIDTNSGRTVYMAVPPRIGTQIAFPASPDHVSRGYALVAGEPVVFDSAEHENEFFGKFPEAAKTIKVEMPDKPSDISSLVHPVEGNVSTEVGALRLQNAALQKTLEEMSTMLKGLMEKAQNTPKKSTKKRKYTRHVQPEQSPPTG